MRARAADSYALGSKVSCVDVVMDLRLGARECVKLRSFLDKYRDKWRVAKLEASKEARSG